MRFTETDSIHSLDAMVVVMHCPWVHSFMCLVFLTICVYMLRPTVT